MGSGKSSVAKALANRLSLPVIDMDDCIQHSSGLSIKQIFATEGEKGFRQRETALLQTMFERERVVLSSGGGVVTSKVNRSLLKQLGFVVYLKVDAIVALSRIGNVESRPLLSGEPEVKEPEARELLATRESLYTEVADCQIDTNKLSISEVTDSIMDLLKQNAQF
jgi:shikimate kinase